MLSLTIFQTLHHMGARFRRYHCLQTAFPHGIVHLSLVNGLSVAGWTILRLDISSNASQSRSGYSLLVGTYVVDI